MTYDTFFIKLWVEYYNFLIVESISKYFEFSLANKTVKIYNMHRSVNKLCSLNISLYIITYYNNLAYEYTFEVSTLREMKQKQGLRQWQWLGAVKEGEGWLIHI